MSTPYGIAADLFTTIPGRAAAKERLELYAGALGYKTSFLLPYEQWSVFTNEADHGLGARGCGFAVVDYRSCTHMVPETPHSFQGILRYARNVPDNFVLDPKYGARGFYVLMTYGDAPAGVPTYCGWSAWLLELPRSLAPVPDTVVVGDVQLNRSAITDLLAQHGAKDDPLTLKVRSGVPLTDADAIAAAKREGVEIP